MCKVTSFSHGVIISYYTKASPFKGVIQVRKNHEIAHATRRDSELIP
jgi:hypothetical protein